jgi:predicted PurR-regulated permease PerM
MKPAKGAVTAIATILGALILWKVHAAVVLVLASLAMAAAVSLVVESMRRKGAPRALGLVVAYAAGLVLTAALVLIVGRGLVVDAPRSADRVAASYDALKAGAPAAHGLVRTILDRLPASSDVFERIGGAPSSALAMGALGATRALLDGVIFLILSLVLSIYWAGRGIQIERLVGTLIGLPRCAVVFRHWRALGRLAGEHVRRALVECALCAVTLALALWLAGVETWALAAAAAALSLLVPFGGPLLAVLAVGVAALASGPTLALASTFIAAVVVVTLRGWVAPRLVPMRRANPLVVIAAAMVLASALGPAALILAPLAAAVASMVARRVLARRVVARRERDDLAALAANVHLLGSVVQKAETAVPEDVRKLVDRLRVLVLEGEASLAAQAPAPVK